MIAIFFADVGDTEMVPNTAIFNDFNNSNCVANAVENQCSNSFH